MFVVFHLEHQEDVNFHVLLLVFSVQIYSVISYLVMKVKKTADSIMGT